MWMIWGYPHGPWLRKPPLSALLCEYLAPFVEMIYEIKLICLAIYSVFGCGHGKDIKHRLDDCKFERCAAPCSLSCHMILDSLFDIFLSTACHGPALSSQGSVGSVLSIRNGNPQRKSRINDGRSLHSRAASGNVWDLVDLGDLVARQDALHPAMQMPLFEQNGFILEFSPRWMSDIRTIQKSWYEFAVCLFIERLCYAWSSNLWRTAAERRLSCCGLFGCGHHLCCNCCNVVINKTGRLSWTIDRDEQASSIHRSLYIDSSAYKAYIIYISSISSLYWK